MTPAGGSAGDRGDVGRAEQAERTRAALLLAAAAEFEQRGFAATSLTDVSDRLGLVRATVHFHFATKKLLAEALVDHLAQAWQEIRADRGSQVPGGGLQRLRWDSEQVVAGYLGDPRQRAGLRLAIEPELAATRGLAGQWVAHVAELLTPLDRQESAALLVHGFAGVLVSIRRDVTPEEAREIVVEFWNLVEPGLA